MQPIAMIYYLVQLDLFLLFGKICGMEIEVLTYIKDLLYLNNFYFETFDPVKVSLSKIKVVNGLGDTYEIGILPTLQDCIMSW